MNILSIDTSTRNLSMALGDDDQVVSFQNLAVGHRLSDTLLHKIALFLAKQDLSLNQIDAFCVGLGPGFFTSMRVGLSTIKGLVFALQKPVVGVVSLDAIALVVGEAPSICVITDARRDLLYAGFYSNKAGKLIRNELDLLSIDQVLSKVTEKTIFVGSGVEIYKDKIKKFKHTDQLIADEKKGLPQAKYLIPLGFKYLKNKPKGDNISQLLPVYLYPEDCQVHR